jgi:hypothetical protein
MNSKKWIDSNGAIYDSYKSDYMIFVNRNCDFNFLKNSELNHIILIKDENRIKSFVKFCERENKMIIYIKKSFQKDVLNDITTKNYILINYNSKKLENDFDILLPVIKSRITEIENLKNFKIQTVRKNDEDDDEEIDMTDVESV